MTDDMLLFGSKFRRVSTGIVSENKAVSEKRISVIPIELASGVNGDLLDVLDELDTSGVDNDGFEYTITLKTSSSIIATWLPSGSNRVTPPNVRRGERVHLYQYADVDHYFWEPMGLDDDLRRLETVIFAWSATSDENAELDLLENMYSIEVSTHNKAITLRTSKANGEPFAYTIQLNADKGVFVLADDVGNVIELDSSATKITAINADKTRVVLDKKVIDAYAKDEINTVCDGDTNVETKNDLTAYAGNDITAEAGNNVSMVAGGNITVEAGGDVSGTAGGNIQIAADGNILLTGGGISITMAGGVINLG